MQLDDARMIARTDKGNVRDAIAALPAQVREAWQDASEVRIPRTHRDACEVVVAGMGGSALGAHLIQSVYGDQMEMAFSTTSDYRLPGSVGKWSVVVLSSYSGTTEEVLACLKDAVRRKAKLMGITSGGPLARALRRLKAPAYIFDPRHNPGNQPRMGLGYMTAGTLALMNSLGALAVDGKEIIRLAGRLATAQERWAPEIPGRSNQAKLLARTLEGRIPIFIAAEHLVGNAHILQNQVQESAKRFANYFPLPEANHHLMEGLAFPKELKRLLTFVLIDSKLYAPRMRTRLVATAEVLDRQGFDFHEFRPAEPTRLGQAFETLAFGSALSFQMSMRAGVDPSDIPWVDFFKKRLARG